LYHGLEEGGFIFERTSVMRHPIHINGSYGPTIGKQEHIKVKVILISISQILNSDGPYSDMAFDLNTPPYYTETYDEYPSEKFKLSGPTA
jgi:hypothetical protein